MNRLFKTPGYLAIASVGLAGTAVSATLIAGYSIVVVGIGILFFLSGILWGRSEVLQQVVMSTPKDELTSARRKRSE